ncbi:MAG: DUF3604 domain-containing protein [Kiritimatiellaeota bacterium]|nr:DUF3604 domain-containing protein [Kiritimatiellota bacterium]
MNHVQKLDLGHAAVTPAGPFQAGAWVSLRYTYTAGHPVDDSGAIKIAFRFASDCGTPQFDDPGAPHYCSIHTTGDCRIQPRWDPKGNTRPWGRCLILKVAGGYLDRGDTITVVFGDTAAGSPGWRLQTFCEDTFEFKTMVDPIATYRFKELPKSPVIRIGPGVPARAVCIAPSQISVGEPVKAHLKLEDGWGNPVTVPRTITCEAFPRTGVHTVTCTDPETGLAARSNPIEVGPPRRYRRFWADWHGQSEETIGTNTIGDYFRFARDFALLDAAAHQGNDFQVTDEFWEVVNRTAAEFYEPGRFVTFPGYEWSGNTPLGGDRNIYFSAEGARLVHSCADLLPGEASANPIAMTATELFRELHKETAARPFAFAHVGGRFADMARHDDAIEIAVEIHSAWGTFEWLALDALARGARVGFCANSDGHKGRPGASYPGASKFGSYGGLTCLLAERLDRESLLDALLHRRFYATTGNRPLLWVSARTANGQPAVMGEILEASETGAPVRLRIVAHGTASLEEIRVRNGAEPVAVHRPFDADSLGRRLKIVWGGAEVRGRDRLSRWQGDLVVHGARLLDVRPVSFWNPHNLPEICGNTVRWRSVTTGGDAGLILTLDDAARAEITLRLNGRTWTLTPGRLGPEPERTDLGGLGKHMTVQRLPDADPPCELRIDVSVRGLRSGDNPLWVRVTQVDGHRAWTSPIVVRLP